MYIRLLYIYICFFNILFFSFLHKPLHLKSHFYFFHRRSSSRLSAYEELPHHMGEQKRLLQRTATCHWISSGIILPNIWGIMNTVKKNCDSINLVGGNIFAGTPNQFHGNNHGFRWRFSLTPIQSEPGVVKHQGQVEVCGRRLRIKWKWRNGEMWSTLWSFVT